MRIRVIFVIFILALLLVQFLLPRNNAEVKTQESNTGEVFETQKSINFL